MLYNELILSGRLHTVVADLNEQAADRLDLIIRQMMKAEGVTEAMKNCLTENVASLRSVKVATPPCAAKAAIPCGLAVRKRF